MGPRREMAVIAEAMRGALDGGTQDFLARLEVDLERRGCVLPSETVGEKVPAPNRSSRGERL